MDERLSVNRVILAIALTSVQQTVIGKRLPARERMGEEANDMTGRMYMRLSRALGDAESPELMAHHQAALERVAAERGIEVVEVIKEIGSGETIAQRPGLRALLEAYEQGRYRDETLLLVEMQRLCRGDELDSGRIRNALATARIRIVTPAREYDVTTADDEFIYRLQSTVSRYELSLFKQRQKIKRDHMTREGRCVVSQVPFGFTWDYEKKMPRPEPEQFALVQAWCREVHTRTARQLEREYGIGFARIVRTLRNPVLCGYPCRRTRRLPQQHSVRLRRDQWVWPEKPGAYEPACTLTEWQAIQAVLDARTRSRSATWTTDGWCRQLLHFHGSAGPLTGIVGLGAHQYRRGGLSHLTYEIRRLRPGKHTERLGFINRDLVHAAATRALAELFADPERLLRFWETHQAQERAQAALGDAQRLTAAARLAELRRALDGVSRAEALAEDDEHRNSLRRGREAVTAEINEVKRGLARVAAPAPLPAPLDAASVREMASEFAKRWPETPDAAKAVVAQALLAALHVRVISKRGVRNAVRQVIGWEYQPWLNRAAMEIGQESAPPY